MRLDQRAVGFLDHLAYIRFSWTSTNQSVGIAIAAMISIRPRKHKSNRDDEIKVSLSLISMKDSFY